MTPVNEARVDLDDKRLKLGASLFELDVLISG